MNSTARTTWLALGLAAAVAASPAAGRSGQAPSRAQPVFPSGIDLVTVDVVVLDRNGKPVEGLTQRDFVVKENGTPQTVTAFEAVALAESPAPPPLRQRVSTNTDARESAARWFFVVFDDLNISSYTTPRARQAIVQFFDRALRPGDQVMIAPTSGGPWWTGRIPEDRAGLQAFVERLQGAWRPDTSAARIWDHEAMAIAFGRDRQALAQVARRYYEGNLIPEAYPSDPALSKELDVSPGIPLIQAKAREVYREATDRLRGSLGTLERMCDALMGMRGRKTLLLVSEGFIMDPSQREFRDVVQAARNANAAINFVDVRAPEGMLGQAGMAGGGAEFGAAIEERDTTTALAFASLEADGAHSVALDTGGTTVAGTNLGAGLARIAAEGRTYYLLGYTSTNPKKDGSFRRIDVRVNRPDVVVRARGGYYARTENGRRRTPSDTLDPALRAALDAPWGASGIPLRMTSYVFGPQGAGRTPVLLLAEADLSPLRLEPRNGQYGAALDSYVVVNGLENDDPQTVERLVEIHMPESLFQDVRRHGLPVRREFTLAPGHYQARLLLRDRATGLIGSVRQPFEVPPTGDFRLSTPILTDVMEGGSPDRPGRPVPIARRTFRPGTRVYCAFDILGARPEAASGVPRATLAYSLRSAKGLDVVSTPARPLRAGMLGQLSVTIAFVIPADALGEHDLRLRVTDEVSGRVLDVSEPLLIQNP